MLCILIAGIATWIAQCMSAIKRSVTDLRNAKFLQKRRKKQRQENLCRPIAMHPTCY